MPRGLAEAEGREGSCFIPDRLVLSEHGEAGLDHYKLAELVGDWEESDSECEVIYQGPSVGKLGALAMAIGCPELNVGGLKVIPDDVS